MAPWVGIDVSMKTLDFACIVDGKKFHKQVPNDREGFQQMLAEIPGAWGAMWSWYSLRV